MFNLIKESFKPKHLKKASLLVVLMLFLTFSGCSFNNQSSLTASSQVSATSSLAVSTNLNSQDQVSLVAIEVNKLPTRLDYSPNEVISTSGGELRVVYSDYSVRYISMNDSMIDESRLNMSTLGNSSVTLKHQEGSIAKYITYKVNIVPFTVNVNSVALDIVSSDVLRTQSVKLNPIINPLNGLVRDIKWSSSNPLIASVDNNGLVTPLNAGEVIITVTVNNIYKAISRLNILSSGSDDDQIVPVVATPDIANIAPSVNSATGVISNDNPTQAGTLKYLIVNSNPTAILDSWNILTSEANANQVLGSNLSTKPTIIDLNHGKYLVVAEVVNNLIVAAGSTLISLNDIVSLNVNVSFSGVISGNTYGSGTLKYLVVTNSVQNSIIDSWNVLTTEADANAQLLGTLGTIPTLTSNDSGKFLVVAAVQAGKILAADEAPIVYSALSSIPIQVSFLGVISGDTAVASGTVKYFISSTSKINNLGQLTLTSTEADANTAISGTLTTKPTISGRDVFKYLIAVELNTANNRVLAAGEAYIGLADIIGFTFGITSMGVIADDTPVHGGTVWYAIANQDNQAKIAFWNKLTTKAHIEEDIGIALTQTKPTLNYTHVGKYLVVVELVNSNTTVVMGDDRLIESTDVYSLGFSLNGSGVLTPATANTTGSTFEYVVFPTNPDSIINTWNTSTTRTAAQISLNASQTYTFVSSPVINYDDNSKFLIAIELKDNKLVSADRLTITLTDIANLSISVNTSGVISGDTKTNNSSTLFYVTYSTTKQSVIDTWNIITTQAQAISTLGGTALTSTKPVFTNENNNQFVVVLEILDSKVIAAGQASIFVGTILTNLSTYNYSGTGQVLDSSGNLKHATINGATYVNNAFVFDGQDDNLTLPNELIPWLSSSFSVSIWFKPYGQGVIFGQVSDGHVPALYIDANDNLLASFFWASAVQPTTIKVDIAYHQWYNLIALHNRSNSTTSYYLNGTLVTTISMVQTSYSATSYIYTLGSGKWAGSWNTGQADYSYWPGEISRFYATATVLTNQEITNEFNNHKKLHILRQSNLDVLSNGSFANYSTVGTAVKKHIISDQPKLNAISTWNSFTTEAEANLSLDSTLTTLANSSLSNVNDGKYLTVVDIIDGRLVNYDHELISFTNRANLLFEYEPSVSVGTNITNTGSQAGVNGTLVNGVTTTKLNNYNYFEFNGTNQYINLGNSSTLKPTSQITVEQWLNSDNWEFNGEKAGISNAQSGGYALYTRQDGGVQFWVYANGNYSKAITSSAGFSGWKHVVGTFDGRYVKIYINGKLETTTDIGSTYSIAYHPSNSTFIGAEAKEDGTPSGSYWDGKIGITRVYNSSLSYSDITNNYLASRWRYLPEETQNQLTGEVMLVDGAYYESDLAVKDKSPLAASVNVVGSPVFDKFSKSFAFDGSTQYIEVNNDLDLANFTISMWVKMNQKPTTGGFYVLFSDIKTTGTGGRDWNYRIYVNSSGFLFGDFADHLNTYGVSDNLDIANGKWNYVTFIRNTITDKMELYINGNLRNSITDPSNSPSSIYANNNQVISIGRSAYTGQHFQFRGNIGFVSIHNRALNANEVYRNYISYNRFDDSDILVYLDATNTLSYSGSGTTWNDLSVNANNATSLTGFTYSSSLGGYLDFNGSSGSGSLSNAQLNQHYYGKTIFVTAKLDNAMTLGAFRAILGNGTDQVRNFNLYFWNDAGAYKLGYSTHNGTNYLQFFSDSINYTVGDWFTVAVTHNIDGSVRIYFNGLLINSGSLSFLQFRNLGSEFIARADNYWDGPISNIQLYRRPLRASEISKLNTESLLNRSLVLNLDAGNINSYSGSGTNWKDLTGNHNATLINGPTYETTNNGLINFDGTNDYVSTNYSFNQGRNFSIGVWVNFKNLTGWQTIVGQDSSIASIYSSFYFQKTIDSDPTNANKFAFNMLTSNSTQILTFDQTPVTTNTWYYYFVSVSPTSINLFRNGALVATNNNSDAMAAVNGTALINAAYFDRSVVDYGNTRIGQVSFFNSALSNTDALGLYNINRHRYHPLVDNTLLIYLDANNRNSYSGSGSTWIDLARRTNYTISNNGGFNTTNGGSINFNGTSTFVEIGNLLNSGTNYTKEVWVLATSVTGSRNIVSSTNNPFWLNAGTLSAGLGGNYTVVSSANFPANQWRHLAVTFNEITKTMILYIDGIAIDTRTNVNSSYTSEILRVGAHFVSAVSSFWQGSISEVRVYSRDLSASQIQFNFNSTKGRFGIS